MGLMIMLVDYPEEWRKFMIHGETRKFCRETPNEIIEKAKKINSKLIASAGKPFFFFDDSEKKEQS